MIIIRLTLKHHPIDFRHLRLTVPASQAIQGGVPGGCSRVLLQSKHARYTLTGLHAAAHSWIYCQRSAYMHVWHGRAGENLRRMSRARHGLYMVIVGTLVAHGVRYTLPPYQGMPSWQGTVPSRVMLGPEGVSGPAPGEADALRPPGEGQSFMPLFARAAALKL